MIDYQKEFPLSLTSLPQTLKDLLTVGSPDRPLEKIEVTTHFEKNKHQDSYEFLQMIMASIPHDKIASIGILNECENGVVTFDKQNCNKQGELYPIKLGISGFDYIVASWGDGNHYAYFLAEKIWMTLGLSPRVFGNSKQDIIYDDLSCSIFRVAEGGVSNEYDGCPKKAIYWTMRNDYLRRYLWSTNCYGVRVFFYEAYIKDSDNVRQLLAGKTYYEKKLGNGWGQLTIREIDGHILLQVWASVVAITPELCKEQDKYSLIWPGDTKPMTSERVNRDASASEYAYLDDKFLEEYEKYSIFDAVPYKSGDRFFINLSYKNIWYLNNLQRIGRNRLKISFRELYKAPIQEIYLAHQYAIPPVEASKTDQAEEHIVSKTERLLIQLITLDENLSQLNQVANNKDQSHVVFSEFSRERYQDEGFNQLPIFQKLLQVAPLEMYQQDFLSRCKTLNEILCQFKTDPLRKLLLAMGADQKEVKELKVLKLLQGILNIVDKLNEQSEDVSELSNAANFVNLKQNHPKLAALFINNDLRNAEAHENVSDQLVVLENLGFDTSALNDGYGRALDFLLDKVIEAITTINTAISALMARN